MPICDLTYTGRAWCLGDNVAVDGDLMPLATAIARETRPEILKAQIMAAIRPEFPAQVAPGDIIVAGRRFAQGNAHQQAFLAFAMVGVGLVVESIPRNSLRTTINSAIPLLPKCEGVTAVIKDADQLTVDFRTGVVIDHTHPAELRYAPLSPHLISIISLGGWRPMFESRLRAMRTAGAA